MVTLSTITTIGKISKSPLENSVISIMLMNSKRVSSTTTKTLNLPFLSKETSAVESTSMKKKMKMKKRLADALVLLDGSKISLLARRLKRLKMKRKMKMRRKRIKRKKKRKTKIKLRRKRRMKRRKKMIRRKLSA